MFVDEILEALRKNFSSDEFSEKAINRWMEDNFEKIENIFATQITRALDKEKSKHVRELHTIARSFQKRLLKTWYKPIVRFDSLIFMCLEMGDEINKEYRQSTGTRSKKINVVTRLHSRALQIVSEIAHLLKGGYADGAMARWRSLHETSVILKFIAMHDEDVAARFLDFQHVLRIKAADTYQEHRHDLGFAPIEDDIYQEVQNDYSTVIKKYDADFRKRNGWASKAMGKAAPTFEEIEKFVEMDFLRVQYGFSNQFIHSGVDSIGFKLGLSMSKKDVLLSGPSNEGLIEPLQCGSLSLIHATCALISASPNPDRRIYEMVMWHWHDFLLKEVVNAHDILQKKGSKLEEKSALLC